MKLIKIVFLVLIVMSVLAAVSFAATAKQYYDLGMKSYSSGDYKKAQAYFTGAAKMDKRNPEYFRMIGKCLEARGDSAKAKRYYVVADKLSGGKSASGGQKMKVSAVLGFGTVSMKEVNDYLSQANGTFQPMGGGFAAMAEFGYAVIPNLYVGPRLGILLPGDAKLTSEISFFGMTSKTEISYSASMIPLMAGASYDYAIPGSAFTVGGRLHLGMGLASGSMKISATVSGGGMSDSTTQSAAFSGSAFITDLGAYGEYAITSNFRAGLELGYRIANVAEMKYTSVPDGSGLEAGDTVEYLKSGASEPSAMPFDFSGLLIGAKATFAF